MFQVPCLHTTRDSHDYSTLINTHLSLHTHQYTFITPHSPIHIYHSTNTNTHLSLHTHQYTFITPYSPIHIYHSKFTNTHLSLHTHQYTFITPHSPIPILIASRTSIFKPGIMSNGLPR